MGALLHVQRLILRHHRTPSPPTTTTHTHLHVYMHTRRTQAALRAMPGFMVGERALLGALVRHGPEAFGQALLELPRTLRMMYLHAWQSYVWNDAASHRCACAHRAWRAAACCSMRAWQAACSGYRAAACGPAAGRLQLPQPAAATTYSQHCSAEQSRSGARSRQRAAPCGALAPHGKPHTLDELCTPPPPPHPPPRAPPTVLISLYGTPDLVIRLFGSEMC